MGAYVLENKGISKKKFSCAFSTPSSCTKNKPGNNLKLEDVMSIMWMQQKEYEEERRKQFTSQMACWWMQEQRMSKWDANKSTNATTANETNDHNDILKQK